MRTILATTLTLSIFASSVWSEGPAPAPDNLKEFVAQKDATYRYEVKERGELGQCRFARLHMTSQTWKDVAWKHNVWVIVPKSAIAHPEKPESKSAVLLIAGGSWPAEWGESGPEKIAPKSEFQVLSQIAEASGSPAVLVTHIPFQPMLGNLHEDALIAETFKRFISGQGDDWPLLLPMVRSAVRAMDSAQDISKTEWNLAIDKFTVTGASKRGWTTWLTSAVDPRVDALAPMVIDMLNMPLQMKHQVDTWGTYSDEIADYTALNLQQYLQTKAGETLVKIVDPYRYRDRLQQPKLLIFGTNDRYWPLDACNKYWPELNGEKYLLYTPNQGHGIQDIQRVAGTLLALQRSRNGGKSMPKLDWKTKIENGKIQIDMSTNQKPKDATIWIATSETKDFRNAKWNSRPATNLNDTTHSGSVDVPSKSFVAAFGEWVFDAEPVPTYLSTNITIADPAP